MENQKVIACIPSVIADREWRENRLSKRTEVIDQSRKLLCGKPVVIRKGDHVLCFDDILQMAIKHESFPQLMQDFARPDQKNGSIVTLREFMASAAQNQVCEYLYPGESGELGFNF